VPQLFAGTRESLSEEGTSSETGRKNITEGGALQRKEGGELGEDELPREERGGTVAGVGHADRVERPGAIRDRDVAIIQGIFGGTRS